MHRRRALTCVGITVLITVFIILKETTVQLTNHNVSEFLKSIRRSAKDAAFPRELRSPRNSVPVLLLTYMRSGSSLTGDILQHSPGAFYVYEPFRGLGHKNSSNFVIEYVNGTIRNPPFLYTKEQADILHSWFTCNIAHLPKISLTDPFLHFGIKSQQFSICMKKETSKQSNSSDAFQVCARQLQGICEKSPFRIIKTIRVQLKNIRHLLESLPNLKLIHLVRDPRATLQSQRQVAMCSENRGGMYGCTNKYCTFLELNVLEAERLNIKYPDRIMTVFYEDIASRPIDSAKELYRFIGAEITNEAEKYIYNITMSGKNDTCAICTTRSNSSEHISTWKYTMPADFLKIVNERCNYILQRYNFEEYPHLGQS